MEETWNPPIYDYSNKLILAPMVRVGTLPFRLLALDYGADIVYSEEIIALKLKDCIPFENKRFGTIDFVSKAGDAFRTCQADHPNVIQLGAADAITALQGAQVVSRYVNGVDLNMGCPVHFSTQGGMGSALLEKPEIVTDILSTLKRNLSNSITAKIRLLKTVSSTIDLIRIIEQTGVSAISVHTRYVAERPRDPAHWDLMKEVVSQCSNLTVPLILNGDLLKFEDIQKAKTEIGVSSVMLARGAMWNLSIFKPSRVSTELVIKQYLKKSLELGNPHSNSKYTIMQMCQQDINRKEKPYIGTQSSKNMEQLCASWNLEEDYHFVHEKFGNYLESPPSKRIKKENVAE